MLQKVEIVFDTLDKRGKEELCPTTFRQKARKLEAEWHISDRVIFQGLFTTAIPAESSVTGQARNWR